MDRDERYMWSALDLAAQSLGRTSPNPVVGAVVVREGEVVGTGYHKQAGKPHAEIIALQEAEEKAHGATLYVTLEPCCHIGRTPPCTDNIINAGIKKVVIAMKDPNPLVAGKGIACLEKAGISVKVGVLHQKAARLNEVFIKYITTGLPFVTIKAAMTLDGKIATVTGASRWISGEKSREFVHRLRDMSDAIMVGASTVLADNPKLTTRLPGGGRDPLRIIVDSRGSIPADAALIKENGRTLITVTENAAREKLALLQEKGAEVLVLPATPEGKVPLPMLMTELGKRGVSSVLAEGGGTLNYSLLSENLVDKVHFFIAPLFFGGESAPTAVSGKGKERVEDAFRIRDLEINRYEDDLLVTGYVECQPGNN